MTRSGKHKSKQPEPAEATTNSSSQAEQNGSLEALEAILTSAGASSSDPGSSVPSQQLVTASQQQPGEDVSHSITRLLQSMGVQQHQLRPEKKSRWDFWETQPVAQFNEDPSSLPVSAACEFSKSSSFW